MTTAQMTTTYHQPEPQQLKKTRETRQSIENCQWFIEDAQRWIAILEEELTNHPETPRDYPEQIVWQQEWIAMWQAELEAHKAELQELQPEEATSEEPPQTKTTVVTRTLTPEELTARVEMLNATIDRLESAKFVKDSAGEYSLYIPEIEFEFYVSKTPQGWVYLSEEHTIEDIGRPPLATKKEAIAKCKDFAECFIDCLIKTAHEDEFDFPC